MILFALLVGMIAFVLWYVLDRRAKNRAAPPRSPVAAHPAAPAGPVDLAQHDGQTIDFSSGRAVVKDSPADRAAMDQAAREMAEAAKGVSFGPPAKPAPAPSPAPPKT